MQIRCHPGLVSFCRFWTSGALLPSLLTYRNPALHGGTDRRTPTLSALPLGSWSPPSVIVLWNCSISLSHHTKTSHPTPLCLACLLTLCCIVSWTHAMPQLLRGLVMLVGSGRICQLSDRSLWRINIKEGQTGSDASSGQMSNTEPFVFTYQRQHNSFQVIQNTKELPFSPGS